MGQLLKALSGIIFWFSPGTSPSFYQREFPSSRQWFISASGEFAIVQSGFDRSSSRLPIFTPLLQEPVQACSMARLSGKQVEVRQLD
jgi:hypothetical protein